MGHARDAGAASPAGATWRASCSPGRGPPHGGELRQAAGATAAADLIQVSPRGIALRRSDMSEVGGKPEVPESRPK